MSLLNTFTIPGRLTPFGTSGGATEPVERGRNARHPAPRARDPQVLAEAMSGVVDIIQTGREARVLTEGTSLRALDHLAAHDVASATDEILGGLEEAARYVREEASAGAITNTITEYIPTAAKFLGDVVRDPDVVPTALRGARSTVDNLHGRASQLLDLFGPLAKPEEPEAPEKPQRRPRPVESGGRVRLGQGRVALRGPDQPPQPPVEAQEPDRPAPVDAPDRTEPDEASGSITPEAPPAWKLRRVPAGPPRDPNLLVDTDGRQARLA